MRESRHRTTVHAIDAAQTTVTTALTNVRIFNPETSKHLSIDTTTEHGNNISISTTISKEHTGALIFVQALLGHGGTPEDDADLPQLVEAHRSSALPYVRDALHFEVPKPVSKSSMTQGFCLMNIRLAMLGWAGLGLARLGWAGLDWATQRNAMQRNATQCNAAQRNATQRNATQRNATQRNAKQSKATQRNATLRCATLRYATLCACSCLSRKASAGAGQRSSGGGACAAPGRPGECLRADPVPDTGQRLVVSSIIIVSIVIIIGSSIIISSSR